jgi:hypothetical protein
LRAAPDLPSEHVPCAAVCLRMDLTVSCSRSDGGISVGPVYQVRRLDGLMGGLPGCGCRLSEAFHKLGAQPKSKRGIAERPAGQDSTRKGPNVAGAEPKLWTFLKVAPKRENANVRSISIVNKCLGCAVGGHPPWFWSTPDRLPSGNWCLQKRDTAGTQKRPRTISPCVDDSGFGAWLLRLL